VAPGWYHDPTAAKSRIVSVVSCRGSGNEGCDEHAEGDVVGGRRGSSTRRRSTPSGFRGELVKFKITGGNCDEEGEGLRIKSTLQNRNPWMGNRKSNSPSTPSPLSSSYSERVPVQVDTPTNLPTSSTDASLFLGQGLVESPILDHDSDDERNSRYRGWIPTSALAASRNSSIVATKPQ
jgi:hypothetical protein